MSIFARTVIVLCAVAVLANCSRTRERTLSLNSAGPSFEVGYGRDYLDSLNVMRALIHTATADDPADQPEIADLLDTVTQQKKIDAGKLGEARSLLFAYVDTRCDAYLDAVFWAGRTRGGMNRGHDATGSAVTTILAATSAATNVLGIVGAAFGLSGALFDNYFETVLYGLEPSSVRHLVSEAQESVRDRFENETPANEAQLLQQTQDYIRQCTPSHLDFLVNAALQKTSITTLRPSSLPVLLYHRVVIDGVEKTFRLRSDGTVVDESNKAYKVGTKLPDGIGLVVACDGSVTQFSNPSVNFTALGLANWTEACTAAKKAADPDTPPAPAASANALGSGNTTAVGSTQP